MRDQEARKAGTSQTAAQKADAAEVVHIDEDKSLKGRTAVRYHLLPMTTISPVRTVTTHRMRSAGNQ
jgi:hypothetical protein